MKIKTIAIMVFAFSMIMVASIVKADDVEGYGNKFYFSEIDRNVVLIAPNNNYTMGIGYGYDVYLVDFKENRSLYLFINETQFAFKDKDQNSLYTSFYVQNRSFSIKVIDDRNRTLIEVPFIAKGGFIPFPNPVVPRIPGKETPFEFPKFSTDEVLKIALIITLWAIPILIYLANLIKHIKESTIRENKLSFAPDFYKPPMTNAEVKTTPIDTMQEISMQSKIEMMIEKQLKKGKINEIEGKGKKEDQKQKDQ